MTPVHLLAALGSSFAAGPTLEPVEDVAAMRASRNYPHQLAGLLGCRLVDLTVSGATTATILDVAQTLPQGGGFPPQIDGLPDSADVVTVTAGGNDIQLIGSMLYSAWAHTDPQGALTSLMAPGFPGGVQPPTGEQVAAVVSGLSRIVDGVRRRAPRARVVLVDYLTVVTEGLVPSPALPVAADVVPLFVEMQEALAGAFSDAAERSGAELLRMSARSRDHALGSADPWIFGFEATPERTAGSFHPNEQGMGAVAKELLALLDD